MVKKLFFVLILLFPLPLTAMSSEYKSETICKISESLLQSYEPNKLGYTFDSNDVGFMDFTVSLQYPIFFSLEEAKGSKRKILRVSSVDDLYTKYLRPVPYLAFTGRFGQYLVTRKSAPVIGKRFNPKLILRFFTSGEPSIPLSNYLDFAYGHESNGQKIDSLESYHDLRRDFSREDEDPEFARDYISRGWDYLELTWNKNHSVTACEVPDGFSGNISLKYFLERGLLQGDVEEYNWWENSDNEKHRKEFDGISANLKYHRKFDPIVNIPVICGVSIFYTTGYKSAFSNDTIRGELLVKIKNFPFSFWISEGYNSDLVDYYQSVRSIGFCLFMETFDK